MLSPRSIRKTGVLRTVCRGVSVGLTSEWLMLESVGWCVEVVAVVVVVVIAVVVIGYG